MLPVEILKKKRDGIELSKKEIDLFIKGIVNKSISDVQAAAFLTSSFIRGLTPAETAQLTFSMRDSGMKFDFSKFNRPVIDKHSTGGVGDKLSLLLVPILMSCDISVPMISGRGLGHTGGTVDKLESIQGFNMQLSNERLIELIEQNGAFMTSQTEEIAPADKILYHIRDITGNVDSFGLITASILCKKLAEGLNGLVLDLKVGKGAFMQNIDMAVKLASTMAAVARETKLSMRILFTSMDEPLGNAVGNWVEIEETEESLKGNYEKDIRIITEKLATGMILLGHPNVSENDALEKVRKIWDSGEALKNFYKMIESQGGDLEASKKVYQDIPRADLLADRDGVIIDMDTHYIGIAGIILGAGRKNMDDVIDYSAGIHIHKKMGTEVKKGDVIATIQGMDITRFDETLELLRNCFVISREKEIEKHDLIIDEWIVKEKA
jgi:pyrimidine-nucleoside phosphorylase